MNRHGTQVMMLGRVPDVQLSPVRRVEYVYGASTPSAPQNLLRPTLQSYPGSALNGARRAVYDAAQQVTLGRIGRFLGDASPSTTDLAPPAGSGTATARSAGPRIALYTLLTLSSAASAYHGYKRNRSVPWAMWWAFMGYMAPVITPTIAVAQGWAEPKRRT